MPKGKGTYGSKRGRPTKKRKTTIKSGGELIAAKSSKGTLKGKSKRKTKAIVRSAKGSYTKIVAKTKDGKPVGKRRVKTVSASKAKRVAKRYKKTSDRRMRRTISKSAKK